MKQWKSYRICLPIVIGTWIATFANLGVAQTMPLKNTKKVEFNLNHSEHKNIFVLNQMSAGVVLSALTKGKIRNFVSSFERCDTCIVNASSSDTENQLIIAKKILETGNLLIIDSDGQPGSEKNVAAFLDKLCGFSVEAFAAAIHQDSDKQVYVTALSPTSSPNANPNARSAGSGENKHNKIEHVLKLKAN